jgi:hypothetical protein
MNESAPSVILINLDHGFATHIWTKLLIRQPSTDTFLVVQALTTF